MTRPMKRYFTKSRSIAATAVRLLAAFVVAWTMFAPGGPWAPGSYEAKAATLSDEVVTEHAVTRLLAEQTALVPGQTAWFALVQDIQDGWHVYWRNPGDSGLPLEASWKSSIDLNGGAPLYPLPERIPAGPFVNFGHHGEPVFLLPVEVPSDAVISQDQKIELTATWLICEDICVPETGVFTLSMPVAADAAPIADVVELAATTRSQQPVPFEGQAGFKPGAEGPLISLAGLGAHGLAEAGDVLFFPYGEGLIEPAATPDFQEVDGRHVWQATGAFAYDPATLDVLDGMIVATGDDGEVRLLEIRAQKDAAQNVVAGGPAATSGGPSGGGPSGSDGSGAPSATGSTTPNLAFLLVAAFFGGMVLNIMPCVFPILFVKAASLLHAAQADRAVLRRHGVLYLLGVAGTFLILGGALLVLRAQGEQLGWGFHLQSPIVVALSAYVLLAVGLNLSGVFEIGGSLQNVGSGLAGRSDDLGAFFTGALAVFVAAPCIGPFLSAPIGAAALLPPAAGLSIFMVMALGLAAPYTALSFAPQLGRYLPKPGNWMQVFKQALAFPVFAASAFFLWVLAQQVSSASLALAFAGALLLAFSLWLFENSKGEGMWSTVARAACAIALLGAVLPLSRFEPRETTVIASAKAGKLSFDPARIEAEVASGRGVFVDFTAAWCVTCQVNKATIFSRESFSDLLARNDVSLMTADWTRRDPEITEALEEFGANGVPFYVYYPAKGPAKVIPVPISERSIRDAIES